MLLSPEDAELFFKLHRSLMCFVNEQLQVVPGISTPDQFAVLPPETMLEVRSEFLNETDLIQSFVDQNPFDLDEVELGIVSSWQHLVAGRFFIFRFLKKYAVFLATKEPPTAYGVVSLTEPFEEIVGPHLPIWTQAVLLPFKDKIVHDGLLYRYNISFGPGARRNLNECYKEAKERLGIVTQLPIGSQSMPAKKPPRKAKTKAVRNAKEVTQEVLCVIVGMTDQFCRDHLNDEYASLCQKLAEKLARKRPSPLLRGHPSTWASGIVRTIGWANFLHDPNQQPHMRLMDIDACFGIAESTGAAKLKEIRTMLRIGQFHPQWTLPSRLDNNPLVWMLEVNGFLMDIRHCPREAQEVAFKKGLIPYIPADRE